VGIRCIVSVPDEMGSMQELLLGIHTAPCLVSFARSKTPTMHSFPIELICKLLSVLCQVGTCPYPS